MPEGGTTRPTSDRVREAMFSTLGSLLGTWEGRVVADLYAGSGALGLEALSRGAVSCLFVENDRRALRALRRNLEATGLTGGQLRADDVRTALAAPAPQAYDVVLVDAPYAVSGQQIAGLLATALSHGWLADDAVVMVERSSRDLEPAWPTGLRVLRERRYGQTRLWYLRRCDDHARPTD